MANFLPHMCKKNKFRMPGGCDDCDRLLAEIEALKEKDIEHDERLDTLDECCEQVNETLELHLEYIQGNRADIQFANESIGNLRSELENNYYTAAQVDNLISQIEQSSYLEVDELPIVGDSRYIYLVPNGQGGKDQYVYSNGEWINIGSTNIDLSDYVKVEDVIDMIHPVGDTVIRTDAIDPSTIYTGTTWQKISEGRMLLGADSTHALGSTGGSETVTLTGAQSGLKAHSHGFTQPTVNGGSVNISSSGQHVHTGFRRRVFGSGSALGFVSGKSSVGDEETAQITIPDTLDTLGSVGYHTHTVPNHTHAVSGGAVQNKTTENAAEAHENMPPYVAVNIWLRTA